jgi:hypothetical protein
MLLYVDLDLRQVVTGLGVKVPVSTLFFTRGDAEALEIQFTRAGVIVDPGCESLFFVVKNTGTFDGTALVLHTDFTKTGSGATAKWTGEPNFNNGVLDTALGVGAGADVASLTAQAEIGFIVGGRQTTTRIVRCTIENDLYRGGEAPPASYPTPGVVSFYPTVTGLTGGTTANLDGLATVPVQVGVVVQLLVGGVFQFWQLQVWNGTAAENAAGGYVLTDDANNPANLKIWVRIL